jgi:type IV pilus assembly protein PilY1
MRRGGRGIYAFNVTNPATPVLMWRKGCFTELTSDDTSCSTGWSSIGQTWSKPQVVKVEGYSNPVLVFGGGYDTCEDEDEATRCPGTRKGAGVWFVDATNGNILRIYPTHYSVTGEIGTLKNSSGHVTAAYAGDTGGNLYRINVGAINSGVFNGAWTNNSDPTWTQIAAMAESGQPRKFFYGPEVFSFLGMNYVAVGTGNREVPLFSKTAAATAERAETTISPTGCGVTDQFYVVKDDPTVPQSGTGTSDLVPSNLVDITSGTTTILEDAAVKGWRVTYEHCEKSVNKALAVGGFIHYGTNQPTDPDSATSCSNLGIARARCINMTTGQTCVTELTGGGLPPSPVAGVVELDDGQKVSFCIGCGTLGTVSEEGTTTGEGAPSALDAGKVPVTPPPTRSRLFWYIDSD